MKTEPTTETREPSASALRVARAVADLIRTTEVDVNARPINKDDRADYRERAVLDAALLIDADKADLLEELKAIVFGGTSKDTNTWLGRASLAIANHSHP